MQLESAIPQLVASHGMLEQWCTLQIGLRLKIEMVKVEVRSCDGKVLYHSFVLSHNESYHVTLRHIMSCQKNRVC